MMHSSTIFSFTSTDLLTLEDTGYELIARDPKLETNEIEEWIGGGRLERPGFDLGYSVILTD